jgi:hypothetical protein
MTEFDVGACVRVKSLGRKAIEATVVRDEGTTVRVRFVMTGKTRTISRERIVGERAAPKASKLTRTPNTKRRTSSRSLPKLSLTRDPKYLEHVRGRPCCICGALPPNDAHHFGPRGMGQKADDRRTVPLCRIHHDEWHTRGAIGPRSQIGPRSRTAIEREFYRAQVDALLAYADRIS